MRLARAYRPDRADIDIEIGVGIDETGNSYILLFLAFFKLAGGRSRLEKLNERFEVKLMILNLISRLIGVHQLMVFNFYPIILRLVSGRDFRTHISTQNFLS